MPATMRVRKASISIGIMWRLRILATRFTCWVSFGLKAIELLVPIRGCGCSLRRFRLRRQFFNALVRGLQVSPQLGIGDSQLHRPRPEYVSLNGQLFGHRVYLFLDVHLDSQ